MKGVRIYFSSGDENSSKKFQLDLSDYNKLTDWIYDDEKSIIKLKDGSGHDCHIFKKNITYIKFINEI